MTMREDETSGAIVRRVREVAGPVLRRAREVAVAVQGRIAVVIRWLQRRINDQRSDVLRLLLLLVAAIFLSATTEYSTQFLSAAVDAVISLFRTDVELPAGTAGSTGSSGPGILEILAGLAICGALYLVAGLTVPGVLVKIVKPVARLVRIRPGQFRQRPVLIMPMSPLARGTTNDLIAFVSSLETGVLPLPTAGGPQLLNANWLPPLRSIERQLPVLRRVYLVGSPSTISAMGREIKGSLDELPAFVRVAKALLERRKAMCLPTPDVEFVLVKQGVADRVLKGSEEKEELTAYAIDFESYQDLLENFAHVIDQAGHAGFRENEVFLDITPGTKQASVAGAVITLNRDVVICYIDTNTAEAIFHDGRLTREYGMTELSQD